MVEMTQMVSNKFRNMSVLCALFVVIIHCRPEFEQGCLSWYVKEVLENGICEVAVPFFFLSSGFFIAPKIAAGLYKAEVAKRIRTLLVPYVFWVLMYLMLTMALSRHLSLPTPGQLGFDPFDCPALSPLWYVRSLFCLVLLSPMVVFCLKKSTWATLFVFCCLYLATCPYYPMPNWTRIDDLLRVGPIPVLGLFYFTLGMSIRMGTVHLVGKGPNPVLCVAVGLALVVARAVMVDCAMEMPGAYCGFASIPFLMYGLWRLAPARLGPRSLATASFPIYVLHKFFYPIVGSWWDKNTVCGYILTSACVFVLSYLAVIYIRWLSPKFSSVVFGGR